MAVIVNFEEQKKSSSKAPPKNKAPSIDRLMKLVEADIPLVNQCIIDEMQSPVALIPQLAGHLIAAGGKRLRPMLTIAAAKLCGYTGNRHIGISACIEFIHTATLLHDDVVDESDLRRGQDSANAIWGNQPSVLVGDFLFSRAFQLAVRDGSLPVLKVLADASATLAEGEVLQLITVNDPETTEKAYLDVITAKTATLFAAASKLGAIVADRPQAEKDALDRYGANLGIAFQLVDDVLDYSASQEQLGKTVGDDFREGKVTLPIVLAWARGNDEERKFWRRTLEEQDQKDGDLKEALKIMTKHNTLDDTIERARHYGAMARDALGPLPEGEAKEALLELVDFCIYRAY